MNNQAVLSYHFYTTTEDAKTDTKDPHCTFYSRKHRVTAARIPEGQWQGKQQPYQVFAVTATHNYISLLCESVLFKSDLVSV